MKALHTQRLIWLLAGCMMAGAAYLCLYTWKHAHLQMRRLERMNNTAQQLQELATASATEQQCLKAFNALPEKKLTPLRELLLSAVPGIAARVDDRTPEQTLDKWVLRRADITFDHIPLKAMARFIMAAEQERPPWRVAECNIIASDTQAGYGRVSLVVEGLEQAGEY